MQYNKQLNEMTLTEQEYYDLSGLDKLQMKMCGVKFNIKGEMKNEM